MQSKSGKLCYYCCYLSDGSTVFVLPVHKERKKKEIAIYITCVTKMNFYCNCYTALCEPINAAWAYTPYQIMPKRSVKFWCNQSRFRYKNYKVIDLIVTPVVHFVFKASVLY